MARLRTTQNKARPFLDVATAARMPGFSTRHFYRIIEEDGIQIMQTRRKFFILAANFEEGNAS